MSAQRLVIRNGFVVSMDPEVGDIPSADVFVEDGKIVEVGTLKGAAKRTIASPVSTAGPTTMS